MTQDQFSNTHSNSTIRKYVDTICIIKTYHIYIVSDHMLARHTRIWVSNTFVSSLIFYMYIYISPATVWCVYIYIH